MTRLLTAAKGEQVGSHLASKAKFRTPSIPSSASHSEGAKLCPLRFSTGLLRNLPAAKGAQPSRLGVALHRLQADASRTQPRCKAGREHPRGRP